MPQRVLEVPQVISSTGFNVSGDIYAWQDDLRNFCTDVQDYIQIKENPEITAFLVRWNVINNMLWSKINKNSYKWGWRQTDSERLTWFSGHCSVGKSEKPKPDYLSKNPVEDERIPFFPFRFSVLTEMSIQEHCFKCDDIKALTLSHWLLQILNKAAAPLAFNRWAQHERALARRRNHSCFHWYPYLA